jgi:hypothetical protein
MHRSVYLFSKTGSSPNWPIKKRELPPPTLVLSLSRLLSTSKMSTIVLPHDSLFSSSSSFPPSSEITSVVPSNPNTLCTNSISPVDLVSVPPTNSSSSSNVLSSNSKTESLSMPSLLIPEVQVPVCVLLQRLKLTLSQVSAPPIYHADKSCNISFFA